MKILAVDDDPIFLEILTDVLRPSVLPELVTSGSADAALRLIAEDPKRFDCFLLDISMPGKDGISLCKEIRKIDGHRDTPILMITASSDLGHVDRAFAAGATDYISKPLKSLELGARIRVALLLHEQSRNFAKAAIAANNRCDLSDQKSINCFEGQFAIENVPGIRALQSLENDLLRLPQGNYNLAVFALKVEGAEMLFTELGLGEFRNIMSRVARSIATNLDLSKASFAYAGKGIFGAALFGRNVRSEMIRLKRSLCQCQQICVQPEEVRTIELKTIVAESSTPHMWNGRNAADALRRAIDQAETRASDIQIQRKLDDQRLSLPVRPRRHRIDFKRFCRGLD